MMELFNVVSKSGKKVVDSSNGFESKQEAKKVRDSLNSASEWESTLPKVDNSNSMPYVVTKGKDHWSNL